MIQTLKKYKVLLLLLISITACFGIIYVSAQQNLRMSANDPQIQIAEDTASALSNGMTIDQIIRGFSSNSISPLNISTTLSPFIAIYDANGKPIAQTATLNGLAPSLPAGVFDYARTNGQNRFTWQPNDTTRIAVVLVPYYVSSSTSSITGYIGVGRSLREIEIREHDLLVSVGLSWIITVGVVKILFLLL